MEISKQEVHQEDYPLFTQCYSADSLLLSFKQTL